MLLDMCTDVIIDVMKLLRKVCGYSESIDEASTPFGMWFSGLRFGDDSLINLSPEMIKRFVVPCYEKIALSFGCDVEIHFCSTTKLMGEQIIEGLLECEQITGMSTQMGTVHYANNLGKIKGRLAVEAGYGDAVPYFTQTHGSFKNWAKEIKQYSQDSGLVLYTEVSSVDEGKKLLDDWMSL
jgi:hypothetical protein